MTETPHRSAWSFLGLALLLLLVHCAARAGIVTRMQTSYCAPLEDDPGGFQQRRREAALRRESDRVRRALLEIAGEPSEPRRVCAQDLLTTLRDTRVLPLLRALAGDRGENELVRMHAVANLGHFRDVASTDLVLVFMSERDQRDWIVNAIVTLSQLDDERARQTLREALFSERFRPYRVDLLAAVRRQGDVAAAAAVRRLAADPDSLEDRRLGYEVAVTLATVGGFQGREQAVDLVERMPDEEYRRRTAQVLVQEFTIGLDKTRGDDERSHLQRLVDRLKALLTAGIV